MLTVLEVDNWPGAIVAVALIGFLAFCTWLAMR